VINQVATAVALLSAVVAVWAVWKTIRHSHITDAVFYAVSAVEVGTVVLLIAGIIGLTSTDRHVDGALLLSYLITLILVPPVALVWGVAEKSRWGTGVVLIGMWTVSVMAIRVMQVWHG
jgi:hypothetical protein